MGHGHVWVWRQLGYALAAFLSCFRGWFTNDRVQGFMGLQVVGRRISCSILASGQNAQQQLRTLSGCLGRHPLMRYHHSFSIQSFPRADPTSLDPAHIRSMGALSRKRCSARAPKTEALQAGFLKKGSFMDGMLRVSQFLLQARLSFHNLALQLQACH